MRLIFEVTDHGVDHAQYFPGVGPLGTKFDRVVIGAGHSARTAGEDALEQFYTSEERLRQIMVDDVAKLTEEIDKLPDGADAHLDCEDPNEPSHDECEMYHYVSIRWKLQYDPARDPITTE